jgi:hypothetical protein
MVEENAKTGSTMIDVRQRLLDNRPKIENALYCLTLVYFLILFVSFLRMCYIH